MYRLLDVAVLHMVLDFCGFLLFDVRLDIHLGLVLQGLLIKVSAVHLLCWYHEASR